MKSFVLFLASLCVTLLSAQTPTIIRGPYLQAGTDTSMVVRWRTSSTAQWSLKYGTDFNQQTSQRTESSASAEHEMFIGGLQPFTRYYYSIYDGATLVAGNDSTYSFVTNPVPGTVMPLHFWVTGDMGNASQKQRDVRDTYWNMIRNGRHTNSWVWLGDNVYSSGTDQEYQTKMFDIYPEIMRSVVSRPAPGNHDYGSINAFTNDGPYYQNFTMPEKGEAGGLSSNEEGYYSFDYGNVHFISLNSEMLLWFLTSASQMAEWLKDDLTATTQPWKIAYWHQPPYTKGSHDSDAGAFSNMSLMRTTINPILEQYGVDVVLCGHSHNYERSFLINGHYDVSSNFNFTNQVDAGSGKLQDGTPYLKYTNGPNQNKGTVYVVAGNGGQTTSGKPLDHPAMYFSHQDSAGFMTIDVNGNQLDAFYYDSRGNLRDNFTIQKSAQNPQGSRSLADMINKVKVFPNPFNNTLTVELTSHDTHNIELHLLDICGKTVRSVFSGQIKPGKNSFETDTRDLAEGNYIIKIAGGKLGDISQLVTLMR